jgi:GAF domain-containing protein
MTVHFLSALRRPRGLAARQRAAEMLMPVAGDEAGLVELLDAVRSVLATPAALLVLADGAGMRVAAGTGAMPAETAAVTALCAQLVASSQPLLCVPDLRRDPRFRDTMAGPGAPALAYYTGISLFSGSHPVGVVCGIDSHPHGPISFGQRSMLAKLATATAAELGAQPALV